jgi:two-component system response regulator AlgR
MLTQAPLSVLIVDDEPLARTRLRSLLAEARDPHAEVAAEAATATQALAWLREKGCDLVLLDVQMPGLDGLALAQQLRALPRPPLVVFVTAHARHALDAFELDALDYLHKPVRLERLQAALARAAQRLKERRALQGGAPEPEGGDDCIAVPERGRLLRVPVAEVLYLRAEHKYLSLRTATQSLLLEGSLNDFEQRLGARFLRVHRNALVAKAAVRELDHREGGWAVRVGPVNEWLAVSRRQLAAVRDALRAQG